MRTHSKGGDAPKTFKTFPEFSKLTLADRSRYDALTQGFPPIADISFAGLWIWWDSLNSCAFSLLNDNIVMSYWFPGSERLSGFSLIGKNRIDESLCTLFDYLRERNMPQKLVHVPEFVIEQIEYPEMFICHEERDLNEYIFDVSKFYPLNHLVSYRRHRVRKFLDKYQETEIELRQIDLSEPSNQRLLIDHPWPAKGINKLGGSFDEAWAASIVHADELGLESLCLFIKGKLSAYCLYDNAPDKRYIIFKHAKVDYGLPRLLDYFVFAVARYLSERGIRFVNLDSDMGLQLLRMFLITLGPVNYFRKYSVRPLKRQGESM